MRERNGLEDDRPALAIFNNFKGQITGDNLQLLEANNVHVVSLPANCTDCLQPMDISVNKAAKDFLHQRFNEWYSKQVVDRLSDEEDLEHACTNPVDLMTAAMK